MRLAAFALLVGACHSEVVGEPKETQAQPTVPGLATAVAQIAEVRESVRALGVVAPSSESTEVLDARAQLESDEARQQAAEKQLQRLEALGPGVAPAKEVEDARATAVEARAAARRSRQALAAFGPSASSAQPRAGEAWVLAQLAQTDLSRVTDNAVASFVSDAFRPRAFAGRVVGRAGYVDANTLAAPLRLQIADPDRLLRPGMTGVASIDTGQTHQGILVPAQAVVRSGAQAVVFVPGPQGGFREQAVVLGAVLGDKVEIVDGLAAGTVVVTTGAASLESQRMLRGASEEP